MKYTPRYRNIFMYASLQFCGHIEEYFAAHTEKLVVYIVMPRLKNRSNLVRIYNTGKLVEEKKAWSSDNIFLYYISWYIHYLKFIFSYFPRDEKFVVLSSHPISFFGMTLQKLLRPNLRFAYWIGDYFPPVNLSLWLFEKLKKYYHDRVSYTYYLSDKINKIFNEGNIMNDRWKKTVMWGVKPIITRKRDVKGPFNILFVGLLKEGQGIEVLLSFLANHRDYTLKIIGICRDQLFKKYQALIGQYGIGDRVFFPNKFYSDTKLAELAKTCHVGVAVYDVGPLSATFYTDPGKVKAYIEFGLPLVMTNTSAIASYIHRYHCGEIINSDENDLNHAFVKIQRKYPEYLKGLRKFISHFYFENYYRKRFISLES